MKDNDGTKGKGKAQDTVCLIIHGFGGNYNEISPLAKSLKRAGYEVACPALAGHTGKRSDLKRAGYADWIESAEQSFLEMQPHFSKIYIIGFSMGGLIAFNLALKYRAAGVVTINTPIFYWDIRKILSNICTGFTGGNSLSLKRYLKATVKFPPRALLNFRLLLRKTKPLINNIECPVLITQGLDDDTTRSESAGYIFNSVNSKEKHIKFYKKADHLMLHSPAATDIIQDIKDFLI